VPALRAAPASSAHAHPTVLLCIWVELVGCPCRLATSGLDAHLNTAGQNGLRETRHPLPAPGGGSCLVSLHQHRDRHRQGRPVLHHRSGRRSHRPGQRDGHHRARARPGCRGGSRGHRDTRGPPGRWWPWGASGPRGSSLGARCQPTTSTPSSCRGHRSQLHRGLPAGELAAGRRALTTPVPVPASYEASLRGRFALSRISVGTPKSRNAS